MDVDRSPRLGSEHTAGGMRITGRHWVGPFMTIEFAYARHGKQVETRGQDPPGCMYRPYQNSTEHPYSYRLVARPLTFPAAYAGNRSTSSGNDVSLANGDDASIRHHETLTVVLGVDTDLNAFANVNVLVDDRIVHNRTASDGRALHHH